MSQIETPNQTQIQTVVDVKQNKVVPIKITADFPVTNRKATFSEVKIYVGLAVKTYPGGKAFLIANEWKDSSVAPVGALVHIYYKTGTHRHVTDEYDLWFIVKEVGEQKVTLKAVKGRDVDATLLNLVPLQPPTEQEVAGAKAEILNKGWQPSKYDPVDILYHFWVLRRIHEEKKEEVEEEELEVVETQPQTQPKKPEIRLELPELSLEEELEVVPTQPAVSTAAQKAEEVPRKPELVKVYFLSMRLPSRYLVQEVGYEENGEGYVEKRQFQGLRAAVASRIEAIRRKAYEMVSKVFCYVEEMGVWIAVTEDAVREAQEVSKYVIEELSKIEALKQLKAVDLNRYSVKAVPVYLEPENAKELIYAAIRHLSADVEELAKKIEEAEKEQKRKYLAMLQKSYEYKLALLEAFKKFLSQI